VITQNKRHALICQMQAIQDACADTSFLTFEDLEAVAQTARVFGARMCELVQKRRKVRKTLDRYGYSDMSGGPAA
jgi:hypothetical protein